MIEQLSKNTKAVVQFFFYMLSIHIIGFTVVTFYALIFNGLNLIGLLICISLSSVICTLFGYLLTQEQLAENEH